MLGNAGWGCSVQPSFMNDLSPSLGMQHHTVGVATSNLISAALYLNANRVHQVSGLESLHWKHVTISGVHCSAKWSPSFRPSANDVRSWKRRGYPTQMNRGLFDLIQMGGGSSTQNLTDVICTSPQCIVEASFCEEIFHNDIKVTTLKTKNEWRGNWPRQGSNRSQTWKS